MTSKQNKHPILDKANKAKLMDEDFILKLADFFSVFGDATRMRIVASLRHGEMNVSEISEALDLSISAISHQLKILKTNDLVRSRREGKYQYYYLSDDHVNIIYDMGVEHLKEK